MLRLVVMFSTLSLFFVGETPVRFVGNYLTRVVLLLTETDFTIVFIE